MSGNDSESNSKDMGRLGTEWHKYEKYELYGNGTVTSAKAKGCLWMEQALV